MIRKDPYQVLGIGRDADQAEIRRAYHELVVQLHPDRHPDDEEATDRLRAVVSAYRLLTDPKSKAAYDRHGGPVVSRGRESTRSSVTETVRSALSDFLDELASRTQNRKRGRDITVSVLVGFSEAVLGTKTKVRFDAPVVCPVCRGVGGDVSRPGSVEICPDCSGRGRIGSGPALLGLTRQCPRCAGRGRIVREPCGRCQGKGQVISERELTITIPAGTPDGAVRVLKGQGGPGETGGDPGDLEVVIRVRKHPVLRRRGRDIICRVPLPVTDALLGTKLMVPTVRGPIELEIAPGMKATIRIKGRGVPDSTGVGDQIVELDMEFPRDLKPSQRELLERFAGSLTDENLPEFKRFRSLVSGGGQ